MQKTDIFILIDDSSRKEDWDRKCGLFVICSIMVCMAQGYVGIHGLGHVCYNPYQLLMNLSQPPDLGNISTLDVVMSRKDGSGPS